jgi:hypothetical protein
MVSQLLKVQVTHVCSADVLPEVLRVCNYLAAETILQGKCLLLPQTVPVPH